MWRMFFLCSVLCSNRIVFISYLLLFLVWFLKETRNTARHSLGVMWECAEQWKPPSSLLMPGLTREPSGQFQSSLIYVMIFALYQAGGNRWCNRRESSCGWMCWGEASLEPCLFLELSSTWKPKKKNRLPWSLSAWESFQQNWDCQEERGMDYNGCQMGQPQLLWESPHDPAEPSSDQSIT